MFEEEGDERVVVEWQRQHAQVESACELGSVATCVASPEEMDLGAGHERGSDEPIRTGIFIIAIDKDDVWSNATQCVSRGLGRTRKVRGASSEFDRSPQERGGEGIGREDQDVVSAHVAINRGVSIRAGDEGRSQRRKREASAVEHSLSSRP